MTDSPFPPLVERARQRIREHRPPQYFAMADRFVQQWAQPLNITHPAQFFAVDLTTALDTLFETGSAASEITAAEVLALADVKPARRLLAVAYEGELSLETAVKIEVAYLAMTGVEQLTASVDEQHAEEWLRLWSGALDAHNRQQLAHNTSQPTDRPEPMDFEPAVNAYLARFSETSGLVLGILSAYPFVAQPSADLLRWLTTISTHMSAVYRLVQDVRWDTEEIVNVGLFAFAAGHGLSFGEVRERIRQRPEAAARFEAWLHAYATEYLEQVHSLVRAQIDDPKNGLRDTLAAFSERLLAVALMLMSKWK